MRPILRLRSSACLQRRAAFGGGTRQTVLPIRHSSTKSPSSLESASSPSTGEKVTSSSSSDSLAKPTTSELSPTSVPDASVASPPSEHPTQLASSDTLPAPTAPSGSTSATSAPSKTPSTKQATPNTSRKKSKKEPVPTEPHFETLQKRNPFTVINPRHERQLVKLGIKPVASRRRRAALRSSLNVPFEKLPFQCFQEARKILEDDRAEKLKLIEQERLRISNVQQMPTQSEADVLQKYNRVRSMRKHLEWMKIQADINDPLVKKRFEDGMGDMNKPIYRYLAERKWRSQRYLIINQRITQMNVVPDVLPNIDLVADVSVSFRGATKTTDNFTIPRSEGKNQSVTVQPGEFVASQAMLHPPDLQVQVYDKGSRFVSIAIVNPDVPDVEKDDFTHVCHYLVVNVEISPTQTSVLTNKVKLDKLVIPWTQPFSLKGAPYQRMAVVVFQQPEGLIIDPAEAAAKFSISNFQARRFKNRYNLTPIGAHLFRLKYDQWTDEVMQRLGSPWLGMEFKRRRVLPLPYKKKDSSRYR